MKFITKPLGCLVTVLVSFVALLALLFVGGVYLLNNFAGDIVGKQLTDRTGFPVSIADQNVSLLQGSVDFLGVKINNPERFQVPEFVAFNQLKVKVDPWSLTGERIVVEEALLDLASLTLVTTKDGSTNVTAFTSGFLGEDAGKPAAGQPPAGSEPAPPAPAKPAPQYIIKTLTIKIGTVNLTNVSSGTPSTSTHTLNYSRTFTDVTNVNDLWAPIAADFMKLGIKALGQAIVTSLLDTDTYKEIGNTILKSGGQVVDGVKGAVEGAGGFLQNIFN